MFIKMSNSMQKKSAFAVSSQKVRGSRDKVQLWMFLDAVTVAASAALATLYEEHMGPLAGAGAFWHGTLRSMGILLALLCGFTIVLIITSRRLNLYSPARISNIFHEQRLGLQACLISGLLLTGALYLVHAKDISRTIVLATIGLVTVAFNLCRLVHRLLLYRNFERGVGMRNVLIVGTGPEAHALRDDMKNIHHLGYTFKGFIKSPDSSSCLDTESGDVIGTFDTLFQQARRLSVDEIFFTTSLERSIVQDVYEQACIDGIDLRLVPEMLDGLTLDSKIDYIGYFPTIPLH
jgi:FlaA1/EpsC-like NDP-sugar epimerase